MSTNLPRFKHLDLTQIESQLTRCLAENKAAIEQLLTGQQQHTWESLVEPLEEMDARIQAIWGPITHLHSVKDSEALREVYKQCKPKLTDYAAELGQNLALYHALKNLYETQRAHLDAAQQKNLTNDLRDFQLAGVDLPAAKKQQFKALKHQLSDLATRFEQNLMDATLAWEYFLEEPSQLAGLPEHALLGAQAAAEAKGKNGYLLTLDFPCYYAVVTYADDARLRETMYRAFATRASDQGPNAGEFDNSAIIDEILKARHQLAQLLGFKHYAERSLATKMAKQPQQVFDFLSDLSRRAKPQAHQEYLELQAFAEEHYQQASLNAWDISYYSEKLRQHRYAISQEDLRPYFPQTKVLAGMFAIANKLYGINVIAVNGIETWHEDVLFFDVFDANKNLQGQLYVDLYARSHKRGGAWMDECQGRRRLAGGDIQIPVAYLVCNFAAPSGGKPALFSHDEVLTLFHEFGHCLHHLLTQVDYAGVSGINGVPWDAVELPSQFFENWCWQSEALDLISEHHETGTSLPAELFNKLTAAKDFQAAMQMLRQIEFSLFDFALHANYEPGITKVQAVLDEIRASVGVVPVPEFNRFQHSFAHIFAGGYAAGYYSYKWAEVLSSDAFARFEEEGIFNPKTGLDFLQHILERGGSAEPMELFIGFRGREPRIDALLRHNGIQG